MTIEEGVAVLRLDSDELLVGCLVIEQVAGVGVASSSIDLTLRLFRRGSDVRAAVPAGLPP